MVKNTAATPKSNSARKSSERVALYAGVGPELTQYDVDVDGAALVKRGSVRLPANVQYAWPHASRQYFYVASSDRGPAAAAGSAGSTHHISAFRVDLASGALKVFKYRDGVLSGEVSIAPGGGYGFGPRHLDFHPSQPWVYVSLERQHQVCVFTLDGDTLSSEPLFSKETLAEPGNVRADRREQVTRCGERRKHSAHRAGEPGRVPHGHRRQTRLRPQVRCRRRQRLDVLDGLDEAVRSRKISRPVPEKGLRSVHDTDARRQSANDPRLG